MLKQTAFVCSSVSLSDTRAKRREQDRQVSCDSSSCRKPGSRKCSINAWGEHTPLPAPVDQIRSALGMV